MSFQSSKLAGSHESAKARRTSRVKASLHYLNPWLAQLRQAVTVLPSSTNCLQKYHYRDMPVPIYECFAVTWTWLALPHHCTVDHQRPLATRNATHDDAGCNVMAVPLCRLQRYGCPHGFKRCTPPQIKRDLVPHFWTNQS